MSSREQPEGEEKPSRKRRSDKPAEEPATIGKAHPRTLDTHAEALEESPTLFESRGGAKRRTQTDRDSPEPNQSRQTRPIQIGSYEIQAELGRGGMGVVYKAFDARLKRIVALKVILAGGHAGETELKRFQTEAEAVARLRHQNIVQVYEIGEHEGRPFIALEYCEGGCLLERMKLDPPSAKESADWMMKVAEAMEHSHHAGVIHRDLKPANVLFDAHGNPKIADFGLAKKLDDEEPHTRTGMIMGSVGYMSPEQASGNTNQTNSATDIYSIGAMLYCLLSGQPPFQGINPVETLRLVVHGELVPVRRLNSACPRDLGTICQKCLQKTPADRYSTSGALAADLKRFLNGEPIKARPSTPFEQMTSWARRHPLPTIVAGFSVLMLALLSGTFAWMAHRNYDVIQTIQLRDMRVQDLRGRILYLDEVLTNSCALASLTGEPRWQKRYQQHEPELISCIDQAVLLVPDAEAGLAAVNEANEKLVAIENLAFDQVAHGKKSDAWTLLNSQDYQQQKRLYENGLQVFSGKLKEHSEQTVQAAHREAFTFLMIACGSGCVVLLIFTAGLFGFFQQVRHSTRES